MDPYKSIVSYVYKLKVWIDGADWRSWVTHSLVGAVIALVSRALGLSVSAATWAVFVLFFTREAEQALLAIIASQRPHWNDALWDFVTPSLTALAVSLLMH